MSLVSALLETSPEGQDRRLNVLLGVATITALAVVVGSLIFGPKIITNASTTEAVKVSGEIASCRSRYFADSQQDLSHLQTARARLDVATSEGLTAVAADDDAGLFRAVTGSARYRNEVLETAAALASSTELYERMVKLSDERPDTFLNACRAKGTIE